MLEEQKELENKAESELSGIQLEEANIRQKVEFAQTNVERINGDLEKFETEKTGLLENAKNSKEDVEKLHKAGLFVNVWTVNKEEEMKRLLDEVGVDMVTTEYYFE